MDEKYLELLESIAKRPVMYVGKVSIKDVSNFLNGYIMGRFDGGKPVQIENWRAWIETKFMISHAAWHWSRILLHCYGNDKDAISSLPLLYKEYSNYSELSREEMEKIRKEKFIKQYDCDFYEPEKTFTTGPEG